MHSITSDAVNNIKQHVNTLDEFVKIRDTRTANYPPRYYYDNYTFRVYTEFKMAVSIGVYGGYYASLTTYVCWSDASAQIYQDCMCGSKRFFRASNDWDSWQGWVTIA